MWLSRQQQGRRRIVGLAERRTGSVRSALAMLLLLPPLATASEVLAVAGRSGANPVAATPTVGGDTHRWGCVTFSFEGPRCDETGTPNPFMDFRFEVVFEHSGGAPSVRVPGYFAADGQAGDTGATSGRCWRVHFTPDAAGEWTWRSSCVAGEGVAVKKTGGNSVASLDRLTGVLQIAEAPPQTDALRTRGRLRYVGSRYLQFSRNGTWFIKGGCGSPETLLAYAEFDGTQRMAEQGEFDRSKPPAPARLIPLPTLAAGLHRYEAHESDWREGDPTWQGGRGKGLIGGLNYLGSRGVNSLYFVTMNVNGDGRNVWPWINPWRHDRFDCSKLDQWGLVFEHMCRRRIVPHFVLQETENDHLLDLGEAGPMRRVYYRELVARFAHLPALFWNLGEENTQSPRQQRACADALRELDPYDHPILVHNDHWHAKNLRETYEPLFGDSSITGASMQDFFVDDVPENVLWCVDASAAAGQPWIVFADELDGPQRGAVADADDTSRDDLRALMWRALMAGAGGVEWYFGWRNNSHDSDLSAEEWRSRDALFTQTRTAREFFEEYLPFAQMTPRDDVAVGRSVSCLAKDGEVYAFYFPNGRGGRIRLPDSPSAYAVRWFNPRSGGALQIGSYATIRGPGVAWTGPPPSEPTHDWVAIVRRIDESHAVMRFPQQAWATAAPIDMGIDPAGLQHALNAWRGRLNEDGIDRVVVCRRGVVVHQGPNVSEPGNLYSCTKSFTSTLLGLLQEDGVVTLDDSAADYEPSLRHHYPKACFRHFATMTSGYSAEGFSRWDEPSEDWSPTPYVPETPLFQPGEAFAYWDEAQMMYGRVLTRAAGRDLLPILESRVFDPIGVSSSSWHTEGEVDGVPIRNGCTGVALSALDFARFGHLMLNGGVWAGERVLPEGWVAAATTVQVARDLPLADTDRGRFDGRGCYGLNWWTNGGGELMPDAPRGAYYAAGLHHNICLVIPEWEMVVVRLGEDRSAKGGTRATLNHFVRRLGQAVYPLPPLGDRRESINATATDRATTGRAYARLSVAGADLGADKE